MRIKETKVYSFDELLDEDKKTYKKVSESTWYEAWKAVKAWYPYKRKMKSFHSFVKAFQNNDQRGAIKLCGRFKMNGVTLGRMIEEFNKMWGQE